MGHFAQTHSLTLVRNQSSELQVILLARKTHRGCLPCYWLRFADTTLEEAISRAEALLPDRFNVAIAIARRDIADGTIAAAVTQAFSIAGLQTILLQKFSGPLSFQGAA